MSFRRACIRSTGSCIQSCMRPMVIATHGTLASGLLAAAEMIVGPAPSARAVDFHNGMGVDELTRRVTLAVDEVADNSPVLVLVDLAGGSPSRASATLAMDGRTAVLTGVNLPMVIAAMTDDNAGLSDIAAAGRSGIDVYGTSMVKGGGLR